MRDIIRKKLGHDLEKTLYDQVVAHLNKENKILLSNDYQLCQLYMNRAMQLCLLVNPTFEDCHRADNEIIKYHYPFLQLQAEALNKSDFVLTDYLGPVCPRCEAKGLKDCNARRTKEVELQLRSADEASTVFTICLRSECGYIWTA